MSAGEGRAGRALVMIVMVSAMGFVFNLWKAPEPWQTINQAMFWVLIGACGVIGFYAAAQPSKGE